MESSKNIYARVTDTIEQITGVEFSYIKNSEVVKDSVITDEGGITVAEIYNNGEAVTRWSH